MVGRCDEARACCPGSIAHLTQSVELRCKSQKMYATVASLARQTVGKWSGVTCAIIRRRAQKRVDTRRRITASSQCRCLVSATLASGSRITFPCPDGELAALMVNKLP
eukprot:251028-Prorocentrum_minimum.AAC.1